MGEIRHKPNRAARSFRALAVMGLWCGISALGIVKTYDLGPKRMFPEPATLAWGGAFLLGAVVGLSVATIEAMLGAFRPSPHRRLAWMALLLCVLIGSIPFIFYFFWETIHPSRNQGGPAPLHGDAL